MALTREDRKKEIFWTGLIIIVVAILGGVYAMAQWLR
jgi:hypothetical protein